jgi:hypothetical protein
MIEAPLEHVVITGASGGLGAAIARRYSSAGATLGLIARRTGELDRIAADCPGPCTTHAADVRDSKAMRAAAANFSARHGVPDIVIANAGVSIGTLTEAPEDEQAFRDVLDINVIGMVNTFQPYIAAMRNRGSGVLVGIASVAGYRGLPGSGAYSASKAAAISYLESLRVELRGTGVTAMTSHNPYRMPFIMTAETAAEKIATLIARRKTYAVIPWQMAIVARLMHVLPRFIYDPLASRSGRKPRRQH